VIFLGEKNLEQCVFFSVKSGFPTKFATFVKYKN
jgi:hypothetical protein